MVHNMEYKYKYKYKHKHDQDIDPKVFLKKNQPMITAINHNNKYRTGTPLSIFYNRLYKKNGSNFQRGSYCHKTFSVSFNRYKLYTIFQIEPANKIFNSEISQTIPAFNSPFFVLYELVSTQIIKNML